MKLLLTCDAVGGVWTHSLDLASGIIDLGWEVTLVVLGPAPAEDQSTRAAGIGLSSMHHVPTSLEWMPDPWLDLDEATTALAGIVDEEQPDLLHLNSYYPASRPWSVPVVLGAHSCVLSWWQAVKGGPPPTSWNRYALEVAGGLSGADAVVAPSASMLRQLRAANPHAPCCGWAGTVIHNGRSGFDARRTRRRRGVVAVGRVWDEAKNLETVDRVAEMLPWPVEVAGPGTEKMSAARGLGTIQTSDLTARLGRSAVFFSPARYEPFGLAVLEGALSGCALVLSDIPTFRELWSGAALFAPPEDAETFSGLIRGLLTDPDSLGRLSEAARARASSFTVEKMARAYAQLYHVVLDSARTPAPA